MSQPLIESVRTCLAQHGERDGPVTTSCPDGLILARIDAPLEVGTMISRPVLCLNLQGEKQLWCGGRLRRFLGGQSMIVAVDQPLDARIVGASPGAPYLSLSVDLDVGVVQEIVSQVGGDWSDVGPQSFGDTIRIEETDEAVADCARRLVRLLERPQAVHVLRSTILRELHYWLLEGRHGDALRRFAAPDGRVQRVARAIAILRANYRETIPGEQLAAAAGMSLSSFHAHFKSVTSLSPLQFQKQLRLQEARRAMASAGLSATTAAFDVGYESTSQFTREYARLFGAPPGRHIRGLRVIGVVG